MWSIIASVGLKLLDWFLGARQADIESRQAFMNFVLAMSNQGLISKSLHDSYADAHQANLDKLKLTKP